MDWEYIFKPNNTASKDEIFEMKSEMLRLQQELLKNSIHEYISMLTLSEIEVERLKNSIIECEQFYENNTYLRMYHFGYPGNLLQRSVVYEIFTKYEREGYLANNCGDAFERGNYRMDSKDIEKSILSMFAEKFGVINAQYWGYLTTGGSESNGRAIDNGFLLYPDGVLYYCESAHYSVSKFSEKYPKIVIPQNNVFDESINVGLLLEMIKIQKRPAIIILSWGTTKFRATAYENL